MLLTATMNSQPTTRARGLQSFPASMAGLSIVELMVAMFIGLVGILVIFEVFSASEGYRRTTTSGSDAQQNGALALFTIQHELQQAGYGFNTSQAMGCTLLAYDSTQGVIPVYTLVPVRISAGPANGSDTIEVNYGNQVLVVTPVNIYQNMIASTDAYVVANRYGYGQGDTFVVAEPGKSCTLAQATSLPPAPLSTSVVHDAADPVSRYNKPGGSGVTYTTNALVFNLGPTPMRNIFTVNNATLNLQSVLNSPSLANVADGIVQVKAQYGKDNGINNGTLAIVTYVANDGIVDSFDNVSPATTAAWMQVLAVRVGVLARSAQPEKPSVAGGPCDTTTIAPTWAGGSFDLSADPNWRCYRYKVFQGMVPIRNALWQQG